MIVVATDAPLLHRNLRRLAERSVFGLVRTGGTGANGSGDYAIAFSTFPGNRLRTENPRPRSLQELRNDDLTPLFLAAAEATEEAILNSLFPGSRHGRSRRASRGRPAPGRGPAHLR